MSRRDVETLARHLDSRAVPAEAPAEVRELAALARVIETRAVAPCPQFRTDLRAMLLAEAAASRPRSWPVRVRAFVEDGLTGLRTTGRQAAAAGLAALVLVVAGLGAATTTAVPGDFLHTVKVRLEDQRIARAESLSQRGTLLLESASERVEEAERATAADRPASAGLALLAADVRARDGAQALLSVALTTGDLAPVATLERFSTDHRPRIESLAGTLGGDPGQAARDLLTTLERIDARLSALAPLCCPLLTGATVDGLTDLTVIPPAGQPFSDCPWCLPAGAVADPQRREGSAQAAEHESAPRPVERPPVRPAPKGRPSPGATGATGATGGTDPPEPDDAPGLVDRARDADVGVTGAVEGVTDTVQSVPADVTEHLGDRRGQTLEAPVVKVTETVEKATDASKETGGALKETVDEAQDAAGNLVEDVDGTTGSVLP